MEEHFVNYNQALALRELGFDEPCFGFYDDIDKQFYQIHSQASIINNVKNISKSPLKSQVFKWFRDEYKIEAVVACYYSKILGISYEERQYHCHIVRDGITTKGPKFKTYEEAESACIDKLIELVKEKKS
jgi:hypothetical protein